jgi:hypothetical protein
MSRESHEMGEQAFWEQFDHREPDLPDTSEAIDFTTEEWYKEHAASQL